MNLHLTSSEKIASSGNVFPGATLGFSKTDGVTAAYEEPLYENPLQRTARAIYDSGVLSAFDSQIYRFRSNRSYIQELIPGREYYKFAIRRLRNNLHSAFVAKARIERDCHAIGSVARKDLSKGEERQPRLRFGTELYELRSDLGIYIVSIRSSFDVLATLAQTVYGPHVRPVSSFNRLLRFLSSPHGNDQDPELLDKINNEFEWFWFLRDVRDYISHYGALRFSFSIDNNSNVETQIFRDINVLEFVDCIDSGWRDFISFIDTHWASIIWNRTTST